MSHLIDIFLQPTKVFEALREKPAFWLPLLLLAVFSAILPLWYFMVVDPEWFQQNLLLAAGNEMSAADMEKARGAMPGTQAMGVIGAISSLVMVVVVSCLYALYLMLAAKVTGAQLGFKRGLSLTSWSNMPALLGMIVALAGVASMQPNTPLESLMLTNVDPLLVQLPVDSPWLGLARSFSLLNFWSWFLLALGWRTMTNAGWLQSTVVALLPSAVIYGVMALFALT
ncbi:MAG: YIP1 family protein [Pseudomonadota bacterium]|nr:YIP1 family protein [Pseudomonadota bacterium]